MKKEKSKEMKRCSGRYFGVPYQIIDFGKLTPFYVQVSRVAREEGLHFHTRGISPGRTAGWFEATVQPVIQRRIYDLSNFIERNDTVYLGYDTEDIVLLDAHSFLINRSRRFKPLEEKLRELYRIGYFVRKAEKDLRQRRDELDSQRHKEEEEFQLTAEEIVGYIKSDMVPDFINLFSKMGPLNKMRVKKLTESSVDILISSLYYDKFKPRYEEFETMEEAESKKLVVVPPNFDVDYDDKRLEALRLALTKVRLNEQPK